VEQVCTYRAACAALEANPPDLLIVDTRRLRFNGLRLCEALNVEENSIPILLIVPEGQKHPGCPGVTLLCGEPTRRRLLRQVKRLLSPRSNHLLKVGGITLDIQQRTVTLRGEEHHLTPRLTRLLEIFMRNSGRVLTRAFLMKEVWHTNYLDDTRTLEVHIHWLRKIIEDDFRHPSYLITVRKVGYCFNVPRQTTRRARSDASGISREVDHREVS